VKQPHSERGGWFWAGQLIGLGLIAYGLIGLFDNHADTHPDRWVRWFVGSALVHDGLVAPLVCLAGWGLSRAVPGRIRAPVQAGLVVSAAVVVFSWPCLRDYGNRPDNPSALPNDYAAGLLTVLGLIWLVCAALAVVAWRRPTDRTESA
jgi:hypothetical protein